MNKAKYLELPKIIGHRGAAGYAPENTLEGIHTAADMGITWAELDVKLTKDKIPVLFHDDTLDRTTNGAGLMAETDFSHLRELEAGSWFSEGFAGIRVPTLEEAIEVLIERGMGLNLEIKPCPGREVETAEAALDVLSQYWDDHNRLLISSFQHGCLEAAMDMANDWHRGLLFGKEWPENWLDIARHLQVTSINFDGNTIEPEQMEAIKAGSYATCAYTINDPELAQRLQKWGVNSLITDFPDVIEENIFTVH